VAAALVTLVLDSARQAFELLLSVGAGTGLIYLLRWYWWRINAWSEISAMATSFVVAVGFFLAARAGSGCRRTWRCYCPSPRPRWPG